MFALQVSNRTIELPVPQTARACYLDIRRQALAFDTALVWREPQG
jgi:hypothetical protein